MKKLLFLILISPNVYAFGDLEILNDIGLSKTREFIKTTQIVSRQLTRSSLNINSSEFNRKYSDIKRLPESVSRRKSFNNIPGIIQDIQNILR